MKRRKNSEDRKTYDEVFDKSTLFSLSKLISQRVIDMVDFPISTGKEANVFRASKKDKLFALKIYRTSTATFRSLTKYVIGDPRFKKVKKKNIVYIWAKKEYKNLRKMFEIGIRVPKPIKCIDNILVMEYIGNRNKPAPMLKDTEISSPSKILNTVVRYMKKIYQEGKIVHGDMSEYNILILNEKPVIIDVGQSVLLQHPMADELLLRDAQNLVRYFKNLGVDISEEEILRKIKG